MCDKLDVYCILYKQFCLLQGIKGKIIHTPHLLVTVILPIIPICHNTHSFTMGIELL